MSPIVSELSVTSSAAARTQQRWRGRSVVVPPATDGCDMAARAVCCVAHAATLWIASMRRMRSPVTVSTSFHIYWKKSESGIVLFLFMYPFFSFAVRYRALRRAS